MRNKLAFGLLVIIMFSCSSNSKYEYWNLSEFNLSENALADNEKIKLVYSSRAPDNNEDFEYYIHLIVVSQESGDTVNVLTTANNGFKKEDAEKVFNFFNKDNVVTKISQSDMEDIENITADKLKNTPLRNITKVARDPDFDYLADNDFPTVIGSIGEVQ